MLAVVNCFSLMTHSGNLICISSHITFLTLEKCLYCNQYFKLTSRKPFFIPRHLQLGVSRSISIIKASLCVQHVCATHTAWVMKSMCFVCEETPPRRKVGHPSAIEWLFFLFLFSTFLPNWLMKYCYYLLNMLFKFDHMALVWYVVYICWPWHIKTQFLIWHSCEYWREMKSWIEPWPSKVWQSLENDDTPISNTHQNIPNTLLTLNKSSFF